jgi:hypothetical protein
MFRALSRTVLAISALTLLLAASDARALERGTNLVVNGGFEQEGAWAAVGDGFQIDREVAHGGRQSLRCTATNLSSTQGAMQIITLARPLRHPFRISAWSRAQDAEVGQDYDLYLDLLYEDGTPLWGQIAHFQPGSLALSGSATFPAKWTATLEGTGNLRLQESGERLPIRAQWANLALPQGPLLRFRKSLQTPGFWRKCLALRGK